MEYAKIDLSDKKTRDHLQRHFEGSSTSGFAMSIDSPQATALITAINLYLERYLSSFSQRGQSPQKLETTLSLRDLPVDTGTEGGKILAGMMNVGTNDVAILSENDPDQITFKGLRDIHDRRDEVTYAIRETLPETDKITIIAGLYGNSGKWGAFTFYPGDLAPPLPVSYQSADAFRISQEFWSRAVFLKTPAQVGLLINDYTSSPETAGEQLGGFAQAAKNALERFANKPYARHISDTGQVASPIHPVSTLGRSVAAGTLHS